VLAAVNGVFGDVLEERGGELSVAMGFRECGPESPTPKLAVFVHGLCETDESWRPASAGSYGSRLHADRGYSPLYLRYNTGLHVSENGRRLAELLERAIGEWPLEVQEIAFVGHSMGGLVARSACHQGQLAGQPWVGSVRHVFCLGSPHLGAPLEKATNVASWALQRLPETRPVATILNRRSAVIKDLRYGSLCEEDWRDRDPDELLRDHCADVPLLEHATHYFVAASRWRGPLGEAFGDLLVRYPSAAGAPRRGARRIPFEVDNGRHLQGLNHFQLLGHPAVYELIRDWLA
jgi:pimeloyl-ACP methyl ester carboxylesterase